MKTLVNILYFFKGNKFLLLYIDGVTSGNSEKGGAQAAWGVITPSRRPHPHTI
jgi:hypothetical protein